MKGELLLKSDPFLSPADFLLLDIVTSHTYAVCSLFTVPVLIFKFITMIIYNVTIKVDWSIAEDWVQWMQEIYIPQVLQTACFDKHQLVRLLQVDETEGPTYAAQFYAPTLTTYDNFLQHHATTLRKNISEKWGDKYLDFETLMQVVD